MYSKRLTVHDARLELRSVNKADEIDPESNYHIGHPLLSAIDADRLDRSDKPRTTFVTLKYEYGGLSLNKLHTSDDLDERTFLRDFANIVKGLCTFHDGGLYHMDVKTSNIVYQSSQMRLIDFGVSTEMRVCREIFTETYTVWPFEVCMLSGHDYDLFSDCIIGEYLNDKFYQQYSWFLGINDGDLYTNIKELRKVHDKDDLNDVIFPKIDVYGVGIVLTCMMMRNIIVDKELRQLLLPLCRRLTNPFTDKRPTIHKVLELYQQLLDQIDTK